ncbi:MAG TPA: hypothetical protein DCW68_03060 [Rhodospirillaceae bacterium]|nr:MAG: hypothetical protein A2018_06035 [Alphaproteobacteria bacterium GWF2_58_20]HAU29071.1 hypothetical protein [Rhodospirillaceae bacterium]
MILTILKFAAALGLVISFILILAWVAKRYGLGNAVGGKAPRRMRLLESLPLDARRRAILVRVDDTEHLILLGVSSETLLSSKDAQP